MHVELGESGLLDDVQEGEKFFGSMTPRHSVDDFARSNVRCRKQRGGAVAYYESRAAMPPVDLLPQIANALGVSIDEPYGVSTKRRLVKQEGGNSRLHRCLLSIEKFDVTVKCQMLQLLDAMRLSSAACRYPYHEIRELRQTGEMAQSAHRTEN